MIGAGELNRKIVLKQPASIRNSVGGKEFTYVETSPVRAKIEQTNQHRALEVAPVLLNTDVIHVRYSSLTNSINKDWLVSFDGLDYIIHTIEGNKQFVKLIVKAKNG